MLWHCPLLGKMADRKNFFLFSECFCVKSVLIEDQFSGSRHQTSSPLRCLSIFFISKLVFLLKASIWSMVLFCDEAYNYVTLTTVKEGLSHCCYM